MTYRLLFQHFLKRSRRSHFFSQNWGTKILLGFLVVYFLLVFLGLGFLMPEILEELHPKADKLTQVFGSYLLYYMMIDVIARFFLQDLSVLSIQHYLILPIPKRRLLHFLLRSSLFNFFNLLPLFLLVPFLLRMVCNEYALLGQIAWFGGMVGLVLFDHYLAVWLKRVLAVKPRVILLAAMVVALLLFANFMGYIPLNNWSQALFAPLPSQYWPILPIFLLVFLLYRVNYRFLERFTHLDLWQSSKSSYRSNWRFTFLENRGGMGTLMANELKLITRNKRTRSALYITFFFSLYGLIFYLNETYTSGFGWLLFVGIFMTGIFMINYGQFLVAWESAYFDGILTRSFSLYDYFKAKLWLLIFSCLIMYLLTLPYAFFGWKAFYINTASFFYNLGVNSFVLVFSSTYNRKRIDLDRGSAFNYQGTGAAQFVIVLPLILLPILIFQGFALLGEPYWGLFFLGVLGLIGLALSPYWLREIVKNFKEKKYRIAAGFREKS